ncbi:MAG: SpoIID/LytB domain-containing protein [Lachnospiraceae bacterium]|nr:SpoIID/LytB domain-containing protein [Lachnospiraceae bacterium]
MKYQKKGLFLLVCFLMLFCILEPIKAQAAAMTDIRVGLTSLYEGRNSITIKTTKLSMGYCLNNSYTSEITFSSSSGFIFTPAKGYYYILNKTFTSFGEAKKVADTLAKLGVNAYPASVYRKTWKVYVGGSTTKSDLTAVLSKVQGKYGYTYSSLSADNQYRMLVKGKNFSFLIDGGVKKAFPQFKAAVNNSAGVAVVDLSSRSYRGRIEIGRYNKGTLTAVNILNVESYLYGVVPSEMPSSWPMEALKAQAVCARSIALKKTSYSADSNVISPYKLNDTTTSQAYKGYQAETSRTTKAVTATAGKVVTYNKKLITAYYSSTSGGSTEDIKYVWGSSASYLVPVADIYETEPEKAPWVVTLTKAQIASKLSAAGYGGGSVSGITAQTVTDSGRVYSLLIRRSGGNTTLKAGTIREVLDLFSTKFKIVGYGDSPNTVSIKGDGTTKTANISNCHVITSSGKTQKISQTADQYIVRSVDNLTNFLRKAPTDKNTYYIAGMGYGHGVGMSQSGAKGMANAGFTYSEIIAYYYAGCKVSTYN